jgi:hypothetical protein
VAVAGEHQKQDCCLTAGYVSSSNIVQGRSAVTSGQAPSAPFSRC